MELEAKRNKFVTSLTEFLSVATPQVVGCVWVSSTPLSQRDRPFLWFNYLFNGVIESQINNFPVQKKSIYKTEQFGRFFHLLHIEESYPNIDKAYNEFVDILKNEKNVDGSSAQLILLSDRPQIFKESIKKKSLIFDHVEYYY